MAISRRSTTTYDESTTDLSSHSFSVTVASGTDRYLLVAIQVQTATADRISGVTFNGDALTEIGEIVNTNIAASLWGLINPDVATGNVVITLTAAERIKAAAHDLDGVHQTTPTGTPATNSGSSTDPTVDVASATDELVFDAMGARGAAAAMTAPTVGAGQTAHQADVGGTSSTGMVGTGGSSSEAGATTVTMSWTLSASRLWAIIGVGIKPSVGGPVDKAGTDTGSGADAIALDADPGTVADTGSGVDAADVASPVSTADTGAGADTVVVDPVGGQIDDVGAGADAMATLSADTPASDSGVGADAVILVYAEHVVDDVGSGVEAWALTATPPTVADTGSATDTTDALAAGLFAMTISGVSVASKLEIDTYEVEEADGIARARFRLIDKDGLTVVAMDAPVIATYAGATIFDGYVREVVETLMGPTRIWDVTAQDANTLLDDDVIEDPAYRSATESDKARVEWLLTFGTKGITGGSTVVSTLSPMPVGTDESSEQDFGGKTLRQAIAQVAKITGARFYVDTARKLHYFIGTESAVPPFDLSDTPNGTTTFAHYGLRRPRSSIDRKNAVYVRGTGVRGWVPDPPPSAATRRAGQIIDDAITTLAQLDAAGLAYLEDHTQRESLTCGVLQPGLHPGVLIDVTSARFGLVAEPFYLAKVTTRLLSTTRPIFDLELGDRIPELGTLIGRFRKQLPELENRTNDPNDGDLTAGGSNRILNSSHEEDGDNFTVPAGVTFITVTDALHGDKVARILRSAATLGDFMPTARLAIDRRRRWWAGVHLRKVSHTSGTLRIELREYSAKTGGTLLQTTTIRDIGPTTVVDTVEFDEKMRRFGPEQEKGTTALHANTKAVQVVVKSVSTATFEYQLDGWRYEQGKILGAYRPRPQEILPGSVTSPKLADGAVTTIKIAGKAITSAEIDDGAIDGYIQFGNNLRPVEVVSSLPALPNSNYPSLSVVVLTSTGMIYRNVSGTWTKSIHGTNDIIAASIDTPAIANNAITEPKAADDATITRVLKDGVALKIAATGTLTVAGFLSASGSVFRETTTTVNISGLGYGSESPVVLGWFENAGTGSIIPVPWTQLNASTGLWEQQYFVLAVRTDSTHVDITARSRAQIGFSNGSVKFRWMIFREQGL